MPSHSPDKLAGVVIARPRARPVLRTAVMAALLAGAVAISPSPAAAQPAAPTAVQTDFRPIIVGLGAIAGVVAFNTIFLGVEALPGGFAYGAGATVPAEMSVAISRVYATTAAVIGGWIGYYGYGR